MITSSPRGEYTTRLNRVVNHIGARLDEPLTLRELADVAGFSPYHFHRIFKGVMGETLSSFIWRLRLERAANLLVRQPRTRVTDIALSCGFSSHSNFARAFKERFGVSASEFRTVQPRKPGDTDRKEGEGSTTRALYAPNEWARYPKERRTMNVEVKTLPTYHVAYIRRFAYSKGVFAEHLNAAFQQVCGWVAAQGLFGPDTLVIGVPHDNPDVTPNDRCRYDACVTVPSSVTTASTDVDIQDLPGGRYAVLRIDVDEPAEIGLKADAMYGDWLPRSGFQADDRPPLEIYYDSDEPGTEKRIVLDFCIPVTPLRSLA
ncbi:AraC family transcriptional regulator [Kribbella sp. VKM Ac-2569]|nr:AraC family transcriptional regulator [Kribbella sp. VKM Ac-2569]